MLKHAIATLHDLARVIYPPVYADEAEVVHNHWDGYALDDGWAEAQGRMIPAPPPEPEPERQYSAGVAWESVHGGMINATLPNNSRSWLRRVFG